MTHWKPSFTEPDGRKRLAAVFETVRQQLRSKRSEPDDGLDGIVWKSREERGVTT